jgi:hypothetical protein
MDKMTDIYGCDDADSQKFQPEGGDSSRKFFS